MLWFGVLQDSPFGQLLKALFACYYLLLALASQYVVVYSGCGVDFLTWMVTGFVNMYKQPKVADNFDTVAPGYSDATSMLKCDRSSRFDLRFSALCNSMSAKSLNASAFNGAYGLHSLFNLSFGAILNCLYSSEIFLQDWEGRCHWRFLVFII